MRKNGAELQVAESTANKVVEIFRHLCHNAPHRMEMEQVKTKSKQEAGYPLRFKSKAQRERIEKAAKSQRKTLREFLLECAEAGVKGQLQAS